MHISGLIVALVAAPLVAAGMYRAPVIELDAKSFKEVMSKEHASMVAFVAPWCGHCKNLVPEYTAAAASLSPLIPFYTVDCDAEVNKPLCAQHRIQGFPTVKAFPRGAKGSARDYQGERKRGALIDYAKGLVPDRVRKLRADEGAGKVVAKFLEDASLPHALLVHPSAPSIPFLWKVLGHRLSNKASLGYVRDTPKHEILTSLNAYEAGSDSARLIFWGAGADADTFSVYDGALKFNALLEWLDAVIGGDAPPPVEKEEKKAKKDVKKDSEAEAEREKAKVAAEEAAAKRARLQAKMEEAERRDQARREKLAAQHAAAAAAAEDMAEIFDEVTEATHTDAPPAEPENDDEEAAGVEVEVEPEHDGVIADDDWSFLDDGTPVDAPAAEVEVEVDVEDMLLAHDEL